jgi:hypothetical protein
MYFGGKIIDRTNELGALVSVDKSPVISLCSVFTAHCFYVPYRTRAACIFTLLALVICVIACILHVSKLRLKKVLNICVRYAVLTDSSVTRVSVLGAFATLRKASDGFDMTVCLSVRPCVRMEHSAPTRRISLKFEHFSKICRENTKFH